MSGPIRLITICLLVLFSSSLRGEDKKGKFEVVTLPDAGTDFAIHPTKGTVAILPSDRAEVILYPDLVAKKSVENAKTIKLNRKGNELVFKAVGKKNYFIVLAIEDTAMIVIDADRGELIEKIPLQLDYLRNLIVSKNPNDPYAYYCGGSGHDCKIARVNLESLKNEGPMQSSDSVARAMISGDGKVLYTHGPWSPSGFRAVGIDPPVSGKGSLLTRQLHYDHTSVMYYLPDPFGQFVISDGRVLSPDLKTLITKTGSQAMPVLIGESRPFLLSLEGDQAVFASVNTYKKIESITLPKTFEMPKQEGYYPRFDSPRVTTRFLEHLPSETLLLCRGKSIALLAMKETALADEPFMSFTLDGSSNLNVGEKNEISLNLKDRQVKAELKDAPVGVKLDGTKLIWTPTPGDVGSHTLRVQLSRGETSATREIPLTVRRSGLELEFAINQLEVTNDGSAAVALNLGAGRHSPFPMQGDATTPSRIALIDLKKLTVAVQRKMLVPIQVASIDAHYVYASATDSDVLYILNRTDLTDVKRVFTTGRVSSIVPVADKFVFLTSGQTQVTVLKVPELTPAENRDVGLGAHLSAKGESRTKSPPVRSGKNWWYDGVLYDATFSKPIFISQPGRNVVNLNMVYLPSGTEGRMAFDPYGTTGNSLAPAWLAPWSVVATFNGFQHGKRTVQTDRSNQAYGGQPSKSIVLNDLPAMATLRVATRDPNRGTSKLTVQLFDLIEGTLSQEQTLVDNVTTTPEVNQYVPYGNPATQLIERPGMLVAAWNKQIYTLPLSTFDLKSFQPPLHFPPEFPVQEISKSSVVPLPALKGGKEPIEIALRREIPGIDLETKTKSLRFELEPLQAEAIKLLTTAVDRPVDPSGKPTSVDASLTQYIAETSANFERLLGKKPTGVPIWVSFGLVARDANLQTIEGDFGFFVNVPLDEVKKKLTASRPPVSTVPKMAFEPKGMPSYEDLQRSQLILEEKVNRLERRILDLQSAINALGGQMPAKQEFPEPKLKERPPFLEKK